MVHSLATVIDEVGPAQDCILFTGYRRLSKWLAIIKNMYIHKAEIPLRETRLNVERNKRVNVTISKTLQGTSNFHPYRFWEICLNDNKRSWVCNLTSQPQGVNKSAKNNTQNIEEKKKSGRENQRRPVVS